MAVRDTKLNNGVLMPQVGLGTWRTHETGVVADTLKTAAELGYRHIDCAKVYDNQREIGQALKQGALDEILEELQLDYLDLLLSILAKMIPQCRVLPAVNQFEVHVYSQESELVRLCQEHGIAVTAYCPLGGSRINVLEDEVVKQIAAADACTPAQVALSWELARGLIVIPKSTNPTRLQQNLSAVSLSEEEVGAIESITKHERKVDPGRSYKELEWIFHEDKAECPLI
ncbi:hypothetical protein GGI12_001898 [Dipsacomyces acuminosporus]|nr:hypothetical protein GGI12_001898 [Dipsacomyces acuminosporus]